VVIRGEDSFAFEDVDNPDYQEALPESRNVDRPKTVKCFLFFFLSLESDSAYSYAFLVLSLASPESTDLLRCVPTVYFQLYCVLLILYLFFTPFCLHAEIFPSFDDDFMEPLSL
jgi:hypothetical protein